MTTKIFNEKQLPQFSDMACISIQRFAWALNLEIPDALDQLIKVAAYFIYSPEICSSCKDKEKCHICTFHKRISQEEINKLERIMSII
jgi:recombinational DNA repair protein RecR